MCDRSLSNHNIMKHYNIITLNTCSLHGTYEATDLSVLRLMIYRNGYSKDRKMHESVIKMRNKSKTEKLYSQLSVSTCVLSVHPYSPSLTKSFTISFISIFDEISRFGSFTF